MGCEGGIYQVSTTHYLHLQLTSPESNISKCDTFKSKLHACCGGHRWGVEAVSGVLYSVAIHQ
jgi:hypothetical protein